VVHIDPTGTADPLLFGLEGPPYVVIRVQPMEGELARYKVTSSDPSDDDDEDIVQVGRIPERVIQTSAWTLCFPLSPTKYLPQSTNMVFSNSTRARAPFRRHPLPPRGPVPVFLAWTPSRAASLVPFLARPRANSETRSMAHAARSRQRVLQSTPRAPMAASCASRSVRT
jgi:hypothetical protein